MYLSVCLFGEWQSINTCWSISAFLWWNLIDYDEWSIYVHMFLDYVCKYFIDKYCIYIHKENLCISLWGFMCVKYQDNCGLKNELSSVHYVSILWNNLRDIDINSFLKVRQNSMLSYLSMGFFCRGFGSWHLIIASISLGLQVCFTCLFNLN